MAKCEMTKQGMKFASPIKAIRTFCGKCIGGGIRKVESCDAEDCELWAYRTGKNPFGKKRQMSEEQRAAASERFSKMWEDRKKAIKTAKSKPKAVAKKKVVKKIAKGK